jgi:hypothetical protein
VGTYAMATMAGELVDLRTGPRKGADSVRDDLKESRQSIHICALTVDLEEPSLHKRPSLTPWVPNRVNCITGTLALDRV